MSDRREERTRGYLRSALLKILQPKPFDDTTLKEVLEEAGVSKKAFYRRYADILDLAADCYLTAYDYNNYPYKPLAEYRDLRDAYEGLLNNTALHLVFLRQNPNLANTVALSIGRSPCFDEIGKRRTEILTAYIVDAFGESSALPYMTQEFCARYMHNGTTGILCDWIRSGMTEDIETLSRRIVALHVHSASLAAGHGLDPQVASYIEDWRYDPTIAASSWRDAPGPGEG